MNIHSFTYRDANGNHQTINPSENPASFVFVPVGVLLDVGDKACAMIPWTQVVEVIGNKEHMHKVFAPPEFPEIPDFVCQFGV